MCVPLCVPPSSFVVAVISRVVDINGVGLAQWDNTDKWYFTFVHR
jgi:hypothetical protein